MRELDETVINELARLFRDPSSVEEILRGANFPIDRLPANVSAWDLWRFVAHQTQLGAMEEPANIVREALVRSPLNRVFGAWLEGAAPVPVAERAPVRPQPELDPAVIDELARRFHTRNAAEAVLVRAGFPVERLAPNQGAPELWQFVATECGHGVMESPADIVRAAQAEYPYNSVFRTWLERAESVPAPPAAADRPATGYVVTVTASGLGTQQVIDAARRALGQIGLPTRVELGLANNALVALELPEATAGAAARLADRLAAELHVPARRVSVRANTFRDHFIGRLEVEGPDQRRFELEAVPASTSVREIARAVMNGYYQDTNWPADPNGKPKEPVVEQVEPNGKPHQLQGDRSLHENNVRDGATLHVSPRTTAGGPAPVLDEPTDRARRRPKAGRSAFLMYLPVPTGAGDVFDLVEKVLLPLGIEVECVTASVLICALPADNFPAALRYARHVCECFGAPRDAAQLYTTRARRVLLREVLRGGLRAPQPEAPAVHAPSMNPTKLFAPGVPAVALPWRVEQPEEPVTGAGSEPGSRTAPVTRQLDGDKSLHENGVRDGATLHVSPRVTAG